MNPISAKAESRLNLLSILGPACVTCSILALVIKESPFYIDLSATAFLGLLLAWRFKMIGLCLATALLNLVMLYNFFFNETPLNWWEFGFGASLELSFIVTAFASAELKDVFHKACKATCEGALLEIEEWKEKISEAISSKESVASELNQLKSKLLAMQDEVKTKVEKAEMYERLLEIARSEVIQYISEKEILSKEYYALKNQMGLSALMIKDHEEEIKSLNSLNQRLEGDIKSLISSNTENESHASKLSLKVLDLEWQLENHKSKLTENESIAHQHILKVHDLEAQLEIHKSKSLDAEGKAQSLSEKLEELIDKLKNLQNEKEDLEKALTEALNPSAESTDNPDKELKRVNGLYNQLRGQFSEKCKTLDETRQTLFSIQEEYSLFQKTKMEEHFQEQEAFQSYILSLSKTIEQLEAEIEILQLRE